MLERTEIKKSNSVKESKTLTAQNPKKSGEEKIQTQITKLIIEKDHDVYSLNIDTKQLALIKELNILRNNSGKGSDYYNISNLSRTKTLFIGLRETNEIKEIKLPKDMLKRVADYLASKNEINDNFDCASFVHAVNKIPYEAPDFDTSKWIPSLYNGNMNAGDTIVIVDSKADYVDQIKHFAIYLSDGLYISIGGQARPLIITNLNEMKNSYQGDTVYKLKPKQ